ncbi:glycosyltransferase, partial [bacterium]|nr:glycosyltransferase [bacterium]
PSEQTAESWREIGWPKQTLQVVPNWIDWEEYRNLPSKEEAREILGIFGIGYGISDENRNAKVGKEVKVVGYVGRLVKEKGIEVLLDAWKGVEKKIPETVLLIAGNGTPEYEKYLKNKAGLRVRFLGAVADPRPFYVACDLVVVPSLWEESFGLIPLEAVACGALPLVSDRGFLPQIVKSLGKQLIHLAGEQKDLQKKIEELLFSEKTKNLNELSDTCRQRFSKKTGMAAYKNLVCQGRI